DGTVKVIPKFIPGSEVKEGENMVSFTNRYDDRGKYGYGATNTYTKDDNGWNWTSGETTVPADMG
ncbi:MAG: hypothetical protein IIY88_03380, partial [Eubacterium sp.]|nr:hypothetical protein [Eubacterium sp.]